MVKGKQDVIVRDIERGNERIPLKLEDIAGFSQKITDIRRKAGIKRTAIKLLKEAVESLESELGSILTIIEERKIYKEDVALQWELDFKEDIKRRIYINEDTGERVLLYTRDLTEDDRQLKLDDVKE